jgi:hypothetical protein
LSQGMKHRGEMEHGAVIDHINVKSELAPAPVAQCALCPLFCELSGYSLRQTFTSATSKRAIRPQKALIGRDARSAAKSGVIESHTCGTLARTPVINVARS